MQPNVLFVEDEEALRMTVGDRLRSEGYLVDCAADGDEGFEKATAAAVRPDHPRPHAAPSRRALDLPRSAPGRTRSRRC